nr:Hsp20/alpha crystallin family protein [Candidatus Njordarchaeota archaeon]
MSFDDWFNDDDDDFFEQLKEMQKRVSHLMRKQVKEIIDALKGGEMHGHVHMKPIDGPGIRGYVMWGQLGDAPDLLESKPRKLKPLATEGTKKEKTRAPILTEAGGDEQEEEEEEKLGELRKPLVEKFRSKDEYVILAELPGIDESDLKVDVRNGILEISGGDRFRPTRICLPRKAQAKRLRSSYKNGILEIRIPHAESE